MHTIDSTAGDPQAWLAKFRLSSFRPGQQEVIQALMAGRDCMCIMPTGGGKSLCYQLPAVMRPGVVLVISPLIALMKDQVDSLQSLGLRATFVNSSLEPYEQNRRLQGMATGEFDLVYVSPERLRSARFLDALQGVQVQLLAIDEAHCISEWGHDFRPDYARIGRFRERLGFPQTIALTATATPTVRRDVVAQLKLKSPEVFITGFARPNLRFEVEHPSSNRDKDQKVLELLKETPGAGIIYASTRKNCEALVEFLGQRQKRRVGLYHAGLTAEERRSIQDQFMGGEIPLIVATNAFGMGIDKRNLRLVVHYNMPGSLEAYYQEAGRAGRDGLPSRCILLFSYSDRYIQEFFIENAYPSRDVVKRVYDFLRLRPEDPIELTLQEIKEQLGLTISNEGVGVCEQLLEKCGVLERLDSQQNQGQVKLDTNLPTLVDLVPREAKVQRKVLRELEKIVEDRRGEWVVFRPQKVAAALELDREALSRALRELTRLSVFHYVPPFRGRAIHFLKRDVPFENLEIDFKELERRKSAELEKLDRVIRYAQSHQCRQQEILHYFGDTQPFRCGACDNCQPNLEAAITNSRVLVGQDPHAVEAVRIVLSGVARTRGKAGKKLIARMLCGSSSAQITKLHFDKLSTFGLLSDLNQSEVSELIDILLQVKLLEQVELQPRRPVVRLTEDGSKVMRGEQDLPADFTLPQQLLSSLQERRRLTKSVEPPKLEQKPPLSENTPRDSSADELTEMSDLSLLGTSADRSEASPARRPSYYWTWRLLNDGYSLADCLAIRELEEDVLIGHLIRAAKDGLVVQLEWVLTQDQCEQLSKSADSLSGSAATSARSVLGLRARHIQLIEAVQQLATP